MRKQGRLKALHDIAAFAQLLPHIHRAIKNGIQAIQAQPDKRHDLDKGFKAHRQHQTGLVFGGIDMPGTEQQGKDSHQRSYHQRRIHLAWRRFLQHIIKRQGNGF